MEDSTIQPELVHMTVDKPLSEQIKGSSGAFLRFLQASGNLWNGSFSFAPPFPSISASIRVTGGVSKFLHRIETATSGSSCPPACYRHSRLRTERWRLLWAETYTFH